MNDCVSQVKSLDPLLEERKAQKRFLYIVRTVLIEHYLYKGIIANFRVENRMKSISNMYGVSICLLQGGENLALKTTVTAGTFITKLSIFKCVITLSHLVHL